MATNGYNPNMCNSFDECSHLIFGPRCNIIHNCTSKSPYKQLVSFMNKHFLSQYVEEYTRKNNILDLFLSNNPNFVHLIKCDDFAISDYYLVKIYTDFFDFSNTDFSIVNSCNSTDFDFSQFNLNSADFKNINNDFKNVDWDAFFNLTPLHDFPTRFRGIVYSVLF